MTVASHPVAALRRLTERFGLSARDRAPIGAALVVIGLSIVAFGDLSEDVTHNNGIARHDGADLHFFIHHRTPSLVHVASWVTDLGGVGLLALLAAVVAALLWRRGAGLVVALAPGLALGAAGLCVAIGKQEIGRARPAAALRLATETEPSFPSGHAADSTAFYVTLALVIAVVVLRRPAARVAVLAVAVLLSATIGTSRLVLGVHWPTDVLAGWALGTTVALTVTMGALLLSRSVPRDRTRAAPH